jgi:Spy/CpxP family protein refolding chaperone
LLSKEHKKKKMEEVVMKRFWLLMAVFLLVATMATPVLAYCGGGGPRGVGGGPCGDPAALRGLNLTPEQTTKIDELRTAFLKDTKPLRDKMFSKRGDLRLLWLDRNPDQEKITAAQKEMRALRDQMQDKRTAFLLEIRKTLTPEQQAKLNSYRGGGFGPGFGRGRGPGNGGGFGGPCMGARGN